MIFQNCPAIISYQHPIAIGSKRHITQRAAEVFADGGIGAILYIADADFSISWKIDEHLRAVDEDRRIWRTRQHLVAQEDDGIACRQVNAHDLIVATIGADDKAGGGRGVIGSKAN